MAKKRKKDKADKEEYEFRPPDFDEKEFLLKEMSDTKTMIWTVAYGVLFGIAAGALMLASEDMLGVAFIIGIAGTLSLKYFYPLIKVDTKEFQKKNWLGNIATFFFTFLAIWVLVLNVPMSDHAPPAVENIVIWVGEGVTAKGIEYRYLEAAGRYGWTPLNASDDLATMISVSAASRLNITAKVTDNGNLASVIISVTSNETHESQMTEENDYRFEYPIYSNDLSDSHDLLIKIIARDDAGNLTEWTPTSTVPVAP